MRKTKYSKLCQLPRPEPLVRAEKANFSLSREVKRKWVAALRSGAYRQTKEALYRNPGDAKPGLPSGYCCLGVLCRVLGVPDEYLLHRGMPESLNLPALQGIGWELTVAANPREKKARYQLNDLNDEFGWSFKKIATAIERNVPTHD